MTMKLAVAVAPSALAAVLLAGCPQVEEGEIEPPEEPEKPEKPSFPDAGARVSAAVPLGPPPDFGPVTRAERTPLPIAGGTLTVLRDGGTAVAADPDRDRVWFVDLREAVVLHEIELRAGDEPGRSVEDATGAVHLVLRGGGALITFAPRGRGRFELVGRRPLCPAPRGVAYDVERDQLHVACAGGELVTLPAAGGDPIETRNLGLDLRDVVASGGRLYVSRFRSADILVLDPADPRFERVQIAPLPGLRGVFHPAVAWRMQPYGSGGALVVHQLALEGEVRTTTGGYGGDGLCEPLVRTALSVVRPGGGQLVTELRGAVLPVDVAIAPSGDRVAVIAAGNAKVRGMPQLFLRPIGRLVASGSGAALPCVVDSGSSGGPDAGASERVAPEGIRQPTGEAVAVAFGSGGLVVVQTREPAALEVVSAGRTITLSRESRADTGHAVFHGNSGSFLACASCHPEGGEDGRVWRFAGAGPRRTQSLRGGVSVGAPFHWEGDLKTLPDLYREVFTKRMAGPSLTVEQQRAVTGWLDSIPALPPAPVNAANLAAVARGREIFERPAVGCATCHSGTRLTNEATFDVGTGGSFQTPSLRGLRHRAPFMHDGCAPTLAGRFSPCGGGDKHGVTSRLTRGEIDDLVAYLETL